MKYISTLILLGILLLSIPGSQGIKEGTLEDVDKIVFYAIPQSHTDAGWYWTYEYYYNLASGILNSVSNYLIAHKEARFTWSDHSFFRKWYYENIKGHADREADIKRLVKTGQLDLINGGLVQNDEAGPLIKETYTNFEEGLDFLYEEFGVRPDTVWQLDPFGFSSSTPEVLKSLGFKKVIINRMSDAYKNVLRENQDLDFIWQGDGEEEIYTHTLHGHYGVDIAFYLDQRWYTSDKCPKPLDERCTKRLIEESIHQGVKVYNGTGYVMQLIGNDFYFSNAGFSFDYIDGMKKSLEQYGPKLMNVSSVEFRYATLSEYTNDVLKLNYTIGKYRGDFFVYTQYQPSQFYDHHWGGYFTSRPMFKWLVRDSLARERNLNSLLGVLNFVRESNSSVMDTEEFDSSYKTLKTVREFSPVMLHHDAITGTHGNTVNVDYKTKIERNYILMDSSINLLLKALAGTEDLKNNTREYIFYNPSLYTRTEVFNVTVDSQYISSNTSIEAEIMANHKLDKESFREETNEFTLWIKLSVPPLGYEKVSLQFHSSEQKCSEASQCIPHVKIEKLTTSKPIITLENDYTLFELKENALEIKSIKNKKDGESADINEYLFKYDGINTKSCIYTFKPTKAADMATLSQREYIKYTGKLIKAMQIFGQDNDIYYEKMVVLKVNDPAAHITTRNYIKSRHDVELTHRYTNNDLSDYYTGDSMAFVKRKYIDYQTAIQRNLTRSAQASEESILGLNAYPMVDGSIATYKGGVNVGFVNSQTCAAHLLNTTSFEFLFARSIMNVNQDKGLPERLYEKYQTHFNYKVFISKNDTEFYTSKNTYADQMNDPVLVIYSKDKSVNLPPLKYNSEETSDIDVLSLKTIEGNKGGFSPAMIRLRNRSYKPVSINNMLISYDPEGSEFSYIAHVIGIRYGYNGKETLKSLGYKQKVSEDYSVNSTHNVLKDYRDEFTTFEERLKKAYINEELSPLKNSILLQPGEIANLKVIKFRFKKSEGSDSTLQQHLKKIHEEEQMKEKAYNSKQGKKDAYRF